MLGLQTGRNFLKGGRVKTRTFASIAAMSALGLLVPVHSHAFGLGKIELSSALNQPFQAEIAVTALKPDDEGKLQVQLATRAEFDKAGVERSFLLTRFKFEVVENKGEAKILISSSHPVKEPLIDFLLTATTGKGRLIREYTVLLDPPKDVFVKPQIALVPESKKNVVTVKKASSPKKATYQYPDSDVSTKVTGGYSSVTSYDVGRSDTLWVIAKNTKPSSVISQNQMMMAILNANKTSFRYGNINGLKAGHTLDIPSVDEIQTLSIKQANTAVAEQNNFWKNRNKVASPVSKVVEQTAMPVAEVDVDTAESLEAVVPPTSVTSDEQDTARLQLVSPSDEELSEMEELSPVGNKELTQLSEQLTLAQETIESQSQENLDFKARMDLMEEQLQTLRQLITLKDADLARLQSSLEGNAVNDLEPFSEEVETEKFIDEQIEIEDGIESSSSEMSEVEAYFSQLEEVDDESAVLEPVDELSVAVTTTEASADDDTTRLTTDNFFATTVAKVKTFYVENKQESLIAGFVVALLALILLLFRARGRKSDSEMDDTNPSSTTVTVGGVQNSITESEEPKVRTTVLEEVEVTVSEEPEVKAPEEAETVAFEQPKVVEKLEPATEAITDEDIIKAAYATLDDDEPRSEEPAEELTLPELNEPEAAIKDEEIDVSISDTESEVIETLDVVAEGDELEVNGSESMIEFNIDDLSTNVDAPEVNIEEELTESSDDLLDFDIETISKPETESDDESVAFGDSLTLDTGDINELTLDDEPLSLDMNADLEEVELDESPLELDLTADDASEASLDLELTVSDEVDEDLVIDLDLDSDLSSLSLDADEDAEFPEINLDDLSAPLTAPTEEAGAETSEVEFDLGDFDEIDEAETKLDLAGAYMDMEDPEGARSILEEVIVDGSDEQKERAQALLDELS